MAFRTLIAFVSVALVIGIIIDELLDTRYVAQPPRGRFKPSTMNVEQCSLIGGTTNCGNY